jgi:hypothetical protein
METQGRLAVGGVGVVWVCVLLEGTALANVPLAWALYGGNASLTAGIGSKGVSCVLVVLIEAAVFARVFRLPCRQAVLVSGVINLISTAAGVLLSLPFTLPEAAVLLFPFAVGVLFVTIKAPRPFAALALCTIVLGILGALWNSGSMPPQPPLWVYSALIVPLCLGFGLTLMIEGATAKRLCKGMQTLQIWKGVLLANLCSYLLLVVMLPFFPNPYNRDLAYVRLRRMLEARQDTTTIIRILHHLRASNLFLLGLTQHDTPSQLPYEPTSSELALLREARQSNPEIAEAIEQDLVSLGWKPLGPVEGAGGLPR